MNVRVQTGLHRAKLHTHVSEVDLLASSAGEGHAYDVRYLLAGAQENLPHQQ